VKSAVRSFFNALSAFDFQAVRGRAAENFTVIEGGTVLTLEEFVGAGKKPEKKGARLSYTFSVVEVRVGGNGRLGGAQKQRYGGSRRPAPGGRLDRKPRFAKGLRQVESRDVALHD